MPLEISEIKRAHSTCASRLVPVKECHFLPKVAQERLGHAGVGITLDLYSHVLPGMQAEAADRVDLAVREAINRRLKAKG